MKPLKEYIAQLIEEHRLNQAFSTMEKYKSNLDHELNDQFILIYSRYNGLEQESSKGTLTNAEVKVEEAKIKAAYLSFLESIPSDLFTSEEDIKERTNKVTLRTISLIVSISLIIGSLLWAFQPIRLVPANAEIKVDRFSFTFEEISSLFAGLELQKIDIQNFGRVAIEGDTLTIDDQEGMQTLQGIDFAPIEGIDGAILSLSGCKVQEIFIKPGTEVILSLPEGSSSSQIMIDIKDTVGIKGVLGYEDSLLINTEYTVLQPTHPMEFLDPTQGELRCAGLGCEILFSGNADGITLFFSLDLDDKGKTLEADLNISNPQFNRLKSGRVISSIQEGYITISKQGETPMETILLERGDSFKVPDSDAHLNALTLFPQHLSIAISGEYSQILYEQGGTQLRIAPKRLEWFWKYYRLEFLLCSLLIFGVSITFPYWASKRR